MTHLWYSEVQAEAITDIINERDRQDQKWGVQNKQPLQWMSIIGEEFGEVCKETIELDEQRKAENKAYYIELVQLAATVLCALEDYRRHEP